MTVLLLIAAAAGCDDQTRDKEYAPPVTPQFEPYELAWAEQKARTRKVNKFLEEYAKAETETRKHEIRWQDESYRNVWVSNMVHGVGAKELKKREQQKEP